MVLGLEDTPPPPRCEGRREGRRLPLLVEDKSPQRKRREGCEKGEGERRERGGKEEKKKRKRRKTRERTRWTGKCGRKSVRPEKEDEVEKSTRNGQIIIRSKV